MDEPKTARPEKPEFSDDELAVIAENAAMLQPYLTGDKILRSTLVIAFILGLVAHVVGYLLKSSTIGEPLRLVAELIYAMGGALWTGVVVVWFVQVFPEAKRQQLKRALDLVAARKGGHGRS